MDLPFTLPPELDDLGKAIGLLDGSPTFLNTGWFNDPLANLQSILKTPQQRDALIRLLDEVLPPEAIPDPLPAGIGADEKWHPLLQDQARGNIYLTVDTGSGALDLGIGARYETAASASTAASVTVRLPVVRSNSTISLIAGGAHGPLSVTLAVALGWQKATDGIALDGISAALHLAPFASPAVAEVAITLRGLDVGDGKGAMDVTLDRQNFQTDAIAVILGLVCRKLKNSAPGPSAAALIALLGLDATSPMFPFTTLGSDPHALTSWAIALTTPQSGTAPMAAWLGNLAVLFGRTGGAITTPSAAGTKWSVTLVTVNTLTAGLYVAQSTAADGVTPQLTIGIDLALIPTGAAARFDASVSVVTVPLAGQSAANAFADASLIVTAPGDATQWLLSGAVAAQSLRAGLLWNGSALKPLLEIENVTFDGQTYPLVDLTNANSVIAAASSAFSSNIEAALGNSTAGKNLARLAGLIEPQVDGAAPLVDPVQLAAHPTAAIATLHRNALLSSNHPWSIYFVELVELLTITGPISGNGTLADPWVSTILASSPWALQLVAWNAQTSGNAADPQQLRIGLRASVAASGSSGSISGWWISEVLAFDMPDSGANSVAMLGAHHAAVTLVPGSAVEVAGVSVNADSVAATLDVAAGSSPLVSVTVTNLTVASDEGTASIPSLSYPFPAGFDITDPASLGFPVEDLEKIACGLLTRLLQKVFGSKGHALAALMGAAPGAPGLQSDFPAIGASSPSSQSARSATPSAPGTMFSDPVLAFQQWVEQVAAGISVEGTDYASSLAAWLSALLAKALPDDVFTAGDLPKLEGTGTYDDPWCLPLGDPASRAQGLLWLEPNGPPSGADVAAALVDAVQDLPAFADVVSGLLRYLPAPPDGLSSDTLAAGLQTLSDHLATSDGVVPVASQNPPAMNWPGGTAIDAAHPLQPSDPSACAQILAQIDSWSGAGNPRAVLLIGPAFSDHGIWTALLQTVNTTYPGTAVIPANFDLRVPNVDPASIDLRGVTAVSDFYTADLQNDPSGSTTSLITQIGLVLAQIASLRPGAKLMIVAHSTAGVAARIYAAANAGQIAGLITLGTPHTSAALKPLTDGAAAEALRWIKHVLPAGVPAGKLKDAMDHLEQALDGYIEDQANALPASWAYPLADFASSGTTDIAPAPGANATVVDMHGVPVLALGGQLGGGIDLLDELKTLAKAALAGFAALSPTHLGWGLRGGLDFGIDTGVAVDAAMRLDLGWIVLETGAPEPDHAAHALNLDVSLSRPGGWLVGGPLPFAFVNSSPLDVRIRSAELGATATLVNGVLTVTPRANLNDASYHNVTRDVVKWGAAELEPLLGSLFQSIAATVPAASTSLGGLLTALEALGVAAPDPHGGIGIAAGAVNALTVDPLGYLAPRLAAALSSPAAGFTNPAPNQFVHALGNLPIEIFVLIAPATVGVRTIPSSAGIDLGGGIALAFSVGLPLATMTPDIAASLSAGPAVLRYESETLTFELPPLVSPLELYPTPPTLASVTGLLQALFISSGVSALVDSVLDPGFTSAGLYTFLNDPGAWLVRSDALGDGSVFEPGKINAVLRSIGLAIGGAQPGPGLILPGGVTLAATGKNPTTLALSSDPQTPVGPASFSLGLVIDATRHLTPQAAVTIAVPFPGNIGPLAWQSVSIAFGASASGVSLVLTPTPGQPIRLLPTFDGAAALTGAAAKLLPTALDRLVGALPPSSPGRTAALAVATALGIYDPTNGFDNHDVKFAALLSGAWFASITHADAINAVASLFTATSPLLPTPVGVSVNVAPSSGPDTIIFKYIQVSPQPVSVTLTAGWDNNNPLITLDASYTGPNNAPFTADVSCGYDSGIFLSATIAIDLNAYGLLDLAIVPEFVIGLDSNGVKIDFLPLGHGTDTILDIHLVPTFSVSASSTPPTAVEKILMQWGIPLAADALIQVAKPCWSTPLWSATAPPAPTIGDMLIAAKIATATGYQFNAALLANSPPVKDVILQIATGLLGEVASSVAIDLTGDLALHLVNENNKLGVRLLGTFPLTRDSAPEIFLLFGKPASWLGSSAGVTLFLFTDQNHGVGPLDYQFAPELNARGLGVGVKGAGDTPLVNSPKFRVGAIDGYVAFTIASGTAQLDGGGIEIDQLGLPLNAMESASSSNPVASSLLGSDGGSGNGDGQAINPGVDVIAYYFDSGPFTMKLGGTDKPVVIPVHHSLGPVYIDQIDVSLIQDAQVSVVIGIDGSVKVSTFAVGIDDLSVRIPLKFIGDPSQWTLDLQGLSVGFTAGPVEVAGGLRKYQRASLIEYDGMLSVTIADFGLTIVGSYARPTVNNETFTSLFVFGAVSMTLGGPPFMFVTGLGAGGGYNRQLIAPTDMNQIGNFILVSAIDDGSLANDPMTALASVSDDFPPRRGAFWLAAGVRFTSFELVHSTVVVTIALDGGLEIDVLGISRMALPTEQNALASVELALKARYNSEENLLSVQAQLTDNSYLFSRDCQLTGGFAFFMWFSQGQFVLTLGGYNPAFSLPPQFPSVPRLGFHWSVGSQVVVKGGAYFALTNSCVMAGGSLSATATFGPVSAWFDAYVDFLVAWDPFSYQFDVGVEIGARFQIRVCLWRGRHCLVINTSISIGASLAISGPPFHGTATIDVHVTTITVAFGGSPNPPPHITDWDTFTAKYLSTGGSTDSVVSMQFSSGLLPPDPPGAALQPGTAAAPWKVNAEFSFSTTTRMPATNAFYFVPTNFVVQVANLNTIDIAAMNVAGVKSSHTIRLDTYDGSQWILAPIGWDNFAYSARTGFFPEAMWHYTDPHQLPAAARTITAIAGYDIGAHAVLVHESQAIPISTLIDDLPAFALALPFVSMAQTAPVYRGAAEWADQLALFGVGASSAAVLNASTAILTAGNGASAQSGQTASTATTQAFAKNARMASSLSAQAFAQSARPAAAATTAQAPHEVFARNRQMFGLPKRGLTPLAAAALAKRSAPPLLTPLSTGLTLDSAPLPPPRIARPVDVVHAVVLEQPRLRALTQRVARPVADAPTAMRTTLSKTAAAASSGIPRMRPSALAGMLGAQLIKVPAAKAPRPTKATLGTRALRNADFGAAIGRAHQKAFTKAASDLLTTGVVLGSGAMHVWDVPNAKGRFVISGDAAVRMLCTSRTGEMLRDVEFLAAGSRAQDLPAGTAMVAIECLGALPPRTPAVAPAAGAVTALYAPAGCAAAVGWQSTNMLVQIGPTSFAGHGATLKVTRQVSSGRRGRPASFGMLRASDALRGQVAVATSLPASVEVVIVILDPADLTASQRGDLGLAVQGATLSSPPQRSTRGNRRCLCYDVTTRDKDAARFTVSVASAAGWSVAGVIGVKGKALEWAASFETGSVDALIQDGAMAPGGSLSVKYESATP